MNKVLKGVEKGIGSSVEKEGRNLCRMTKVAAQREGCRPRAEKGSLLYRGVNIIYILVCQEKALAKCNEILLCERRVTAF